MATKEIDKNDGYKEITVTMLTTTDNPFDPFDQFDKWYAYDEGNGYHTCSYLARIAKTCSEFSDEDKNEEVNRAIDEIIQLNLTGNYRKVTRKIKKKIE